MLSKLFPSIHAEDVAPHDNAPSFQSLLHGEIAFVVHLGF